MRSGDEESTALPRYRAQNLGTYLLWARVPLPTIMHLSFAAPLALLCQLLLLLLLSSSSSVCRAASSLLLELDDDHVGDRVLFPEQLQYLQLQLKYCGGDPSLVLWVDGRCYREYETGPCHPDRVLVFDRKLLQPYCRDDLLLF